MKRYSQLSVDSAEKTIYNYRLCQNCIMVKAAFQMPESCWRHLLKQNDLLVKNVPTIVVVACVLHNIHMDMDAFDDSWTDGDGTDDSSQPNRPPLSYVSHGWWNHQASQAMA